MVLLAAGGVSALYGVFYYCITIMRRQYMVLVGYGSVFLLSLVLMPFAVRTGRPCRRGLGLFAADDRDERRICPGLGLLSVPAEKIRKFKKTSQARRANEDGGIACWERSS